MNEKIVENSNQIITKFGENMKGHNEQLNTIINDNSELLVYTFFRSLGSSYVDLYISQDGDTLNRINCQALVTAKDPSIIYKNGLWLIASTGYDPHDFLIQYSTDLLNWKSKYISLGLFDAQVHKKIWAPEWFEDSDGRLYLTMSVMVGEENDIDGVLIPSFRTYITECIDLETLQFSTPRLIELDNKNKIDSVIFKANGLYHMFIKDEYDKYIEHWSSSDLINWSYKQDITSLGNYVEGSTITKFKGKYYLYADSFKGDPGIIYYVTSNDLITWSERKAIKTGFNRTRHGTVTNVTDNLAKLTLNKYTMSNLAIPQHNVRDKGFALSQFAKNGTIETLELIDNCVYSIGNNEHFTINSVINPNNAKRFFILISTNTSGSVTFNCTDIITLPLGYKYSAEHGDNDVLIEFLFCESSGTFKPLTSSNAFVQSKINKPGGWKTITLTSQTISNLDIIDGTVYRVNGGNNVIINGVSNAPNGTHFYLILASSSTGSITINTGSNIFVPGGSYVVSASNGNNEVLIEFIKVDGSTFRLRK